MTDTPLRDFDVAVVGAGPAGLSAAASAASRGARVALLDDNPSIGGQIWRKEAEHKGSAAQSWAAKLNAGDVEVFCGAHVFGVDLVPQVLFAETREAMLRIHFSKLILATGARERFLPFPGWTLPNVMAAGGLQALVKSGLPITGKRVIVAGTGPLLLAVAAYLRKRGADIQAVCEAASLRALAGFAMALLPQPRKVGQALWLQHELGGVFSYWPNSWVMSAHGRERLQAVLISRNGKTRELPCDYLAYGFHLVPNIELASSLGCRLRGGFVDVNERQETSKPNVFCAGEPTGIGGVDLALLEGQIAGIVAVGRDLPNAELMRERRKAQIFAENMRAAFHLRAELRNLPQANTIVCRCEDVTHARISQYHSWRDAKNQTRCGMGPCQGRVCGPALQFLYSWRADSVRPPGFPARVESLASMTTEQDQINAT